MVKVDLVRHLFPKDPEKTIVIADKKEYYFVFTSLTKLSTSQTKLDTIIHRKNKNRNI